MKQIKKGIVFICLLLLVFPIITYAEESVVSNVIRGDGVTESETKKEEPKISISIGNIKRVKKEDNTKTKKKQDPTLVIILTGICVIADIIVFILYKREK